MAQKTKSAQAARRSPRPRFRRRDLLQQMRVTVAVDVVPAGVILIRRFTEAVRSGSVPAPDVLQDLATRLQQILDGTEPEKALGLQPGKGVKRTVNQQFKDQDIAWDVADLYEQLGMGRGTLGRAYEAVGRKHHKSASAVKKIYLAERRRRPEWFARKRTKK